MTGLRNIKTRGFGCLVLAVVLIVVSIALPGSIGAAADTISRTRDLPLPERWRARYISDPVFNSRVYVVEAGQPDGPPVLLVHGLGQSGYQDWWEVMHGLEAEYRVIALDLPGFGRSGRRAGALSPPRYAALLDRIMRRLELSDVHLVGHSMGGAVSLYLAGRYPSRIANVVLVDVAGVLHRVAFLRGVAKEHLEDYRLPAILSSYKKHLFDLGGRLVEKFMITSQIDAARILRQGNRNWNALLSDQPNINAAVSLLETDFSRVLSGFDRPVTIIWGGADNITPIRTGHLLHGRLPYSVFHVIEDAGHVPMRSHNRRFMEHLRQALNNSPAPRRDERVERKARADLICSDEPGDTVSGHFDRIIIERCPGMRLVNVSARFVSISESARIRLRHVEINSDTVALDINRSNVTATDVQVSGDPAVRIGNSRLDLAGGVLAAPAAALRVVGPSTLILSVSRIDSGIREGFLHGAILAGDAVLDNAVKLRSE